jgi:streptogramin lyase
MGKNILQTTYFMCNMCNRLKFSYKFFTFYLAVILLFSSVAFSKDLGNGFRDHGVATPCSNQRGIVVTKDENNRDVVLTWLFDHRGCYSLLMIEAESGKSDQFQVPFPVGDAVYFSLLSSKNKYYTLFNSYFCEFDPVKRAFTFYKEALPSDAMGMTEDDKGIIWAVTYPNSGVVSFNPQTKEFKDYGSVYKQNWRQYPVSIASDDSGWIYFGLGNTASQIIAFDPLSGKAKPMLEESERKRGSARVYRDVNGKVYGQALRSNNEEWYEFYRGFRINTSKNPSVKIQSFIAGNQGLFHGDFPDGKKLRILDLLERKLIVDDPKTKTSKEVNFHYDSEGGWVLGVGASPDGTIVGGSSFPMRFFSFNPKTDSWVNHPAYGQFNTQAKLDDRVYFGSYGGGTLLEWNPSRSWINTKEGEKTNPHYLAASVLYTHRPLRVLPYPDKKTIILSGEPEYGYTGGGLLFYDREKKVTKVVKDSAVILDQSSMSMVSLPNGKFLGGTTTTPGTGGEKKAKEAELYIMDVNSRNLEWHQALLPGVQDYSDMCSGPDGLIYGIADFHRFFVFDPDKRTVIYQRNFESDFGRTTGSQSPRIFVKGPENNIYILCFKSIVKIENGSFKLSMVAESPVPINAGGDYLDGRIYFISGSHLCSYQLK